MNKLLDMYEDSGNERVGFVMNDDEIVEVVNVSDTPSISFKVATDVLAQHIDDAKATWHTHPSGSSNLSVNDYKSFMRFPALSHYIVGDDGVAEYRVVDEDLIRVS